MSNRDKIHKCCFHQHSKSMKNFLCCNAIINIKIALNFYICQNSTTVVSCAKLLLVVTLTVAESKIKFLTNLNYDGIIITENSPLDDLGPFFFYDLAWPEPMREDFRNVMFILTG